MTGPQRHLLFRARVQHDVGRALRVSGPDLRVARALDRLGYVDLRIGGSGRAFSGRWWYEIRLTDGGVFLTR